MSKHFSASDVSDAIDTFAKAGLTADQIIGGALSGALQIAACGDIPTWQAAEYAAAAINRSGLNAAAIKTSPVCGNGTFTVRASESAIDAAKRAVEGGRFANGGVIR